MGYRSDVAYVVAFHDDQQPEVAHAEFVAFQAWVKQHSIQTDEVNIVATGMHPVEFNHADAEQSSDEMKWYPQEGVLMMRWQSVKWYPNYPETNWHQALLFKSLTYNTGAYRFVRVGEEFDDVEVIEEGCRGGSHELGRGYSLYEWVDVHRSVSFSPPSETLNKEAA
jgi:hypothetical protein